MADMIRIERLQKRFGEIHAVNDLSFHVRQGELFAFLGVNGAGKSTTINILCGQLKKDGGTVEICGANLDKEPDTVKRSLGVVFQNSVLDKELSVRDNLESRAALYGIHGAAFQKRLKELTALLDFEGLLRRPVGKLSGGQRRRIDIARALLHSPQILILDEPTTGLDPQTRRLLWRVVGALRREQGLTVFLTTHYMEEAADADYVVILDHGSITPAITRGEKPNTKWRGANEVFAEKRANLRRHGRRCVSGGYSDLRRSHRGSEGGTRLPGRPGDRSEGLVGFLRLF